MFKRIFFSQRTVKAAMAGILILALANLFTVHYSTEVSAYDYFDIAIKLLLSVFLFQGYLKQDLQAMQAGCCGLMVCIVYHQAAYALSQLLQHSMDSFIELGFWGSFFLAGELMLTIIETMIMVNHYMIYVLGRKDFLRIRVNQMNLFILFGFFALQLYVTCRLMFARGVLINLGISHLLVIVLYILIACAELILAIDDGENR